MEIKCYRCGKKMKKKMHMIQSIVYLEGIGPRCDICESCFKSFIDWLQDRGPVK